MQLLIVLSNDVNLNPGPTSTNNFEELTIFHLNARSIRNKLSDIEYLAHEYKILAFTETHLDECIYNADLLIENFSEPIRKDRNCFGGGVMLYISNTLHFKRRSDLEFDSGELMWIGVNIPNY